MNEEQRNQQFDLTAGAFYVVGTLLLLGGLASVLAGVIGHFALPGGAVSRGMLWIPWAIAAGGVSVIALGVAVAKRWRYAGFFLALVALPIATQLPWGPFVVIGIYAWLRKERKTLFPFEDQRK